MNRRIQDILALGRPERETERARNCIALAVECADELGDNEVNSCHLLSGLYREGNGVAFHVLKNFSVTQEQIAGALRGRERSVAKQFQINIDIKTVLDAAFAAADEMFHNYIGTEHLLIGATSDATESAKMLTGFELSPSEVASEVFHLLGHRLN